MEVIIVAIILTMVIKYAVENGHLDWQKSKTANRNSTRGQPTSKRAWSAIRHDAGYWGHQTLTGFPQFRTDLAAGWNAGRKAQTDGLVARQKAKADHLDLRARVLPQLQDHKRRQAEALDAIRAARQQPDPATQPASADDTKPQTPAPGPATPAAAQATRPAQTAAPPAPSVPRPTPTTEGTTAMPSGETNYTEQLHELEQIQADAEEASAVAARKRMTSRLDILQSMGLDAATLEDAAEIDDALKDFEKACQRLLEAASAGVTGLKRRHGGIQEAADNAPVEKIAEPGFYDK